MSRKQIDLDRLKHNLKQIRVDAASIRVPGAIGQTKLEQAYHLSAAVLTTFDPWKLRPFEPPEGSDELPIDSLLANCTLRYDDQGHPRWFLNHSPRKRALARLQTRERLLAALDLAVERPGDRLQTLFEAYVRGSAQPIAQQSLTDLRHTWQIIDWLSDTALATELPSPDVMQKRIAWEELVQPFRYLVKDGFYGRTDVLTRFKEHLATPNGQPPLLIFGAGGVGKSTVLAEFILSLTDRRATTQRTPFTYIDFDQARIDPGEPLTILMMAARQLAVQYPMLDQQCEEFVEEWSYRLRAQGIRGNQNILVQQQMGHVEPGANVIGALAQKFEGDLQRGQFGQIDLYTRGFRNLYKQLDSGDRPWLLVLDTFEGVQLRSLDLEFTIGNFLAHLREQVPQVRIIISGRGQAQGISATEYALKGFDEKAAVAFLEDLDITDPAVARQIFHAVSGNPLSLKLAAKVVKQEKLADEPDSAALRDVLRKVAEGNIQGQLYRRILDHIENPDVRKLAHPGLTLRFITPDLIKNVLAGPCQVSMEDTDAQHLFDLLSREITLVVPEGPGLLRHRPDVRSVMITALHNDQPLVVHAIHKAAIAYYEGRDGAEARAEEIYHRLFVESDFDIIDSMWKPQLHETLERQLQPALYELTPRARAWLAAKLRLTGVEDVNWDETGLPEWESHTEKRVRDRIQSNDWEGALTLLARRRERQIGSRLYFLETTILRQQERWEEARRCAYDGIYSLQMAEDNVRLLDLLRQAIAIDLHLGHVDQAQAELAQGQTLLDAQPYPDEIVALELGIFELKIAREQAKVSTETEAKLRQWVLDRFINLSESELLSHPQLILDSLVEFGSENSLVLRKGLRLMTFGELTDEKRETLARTMDAWDRALSRTLDEPPGVLLREIDPSLPFQDGWETYFRETKPHQITRDIELLLDAYADMEMVRGTVGTVGIKGVDMVGGAVTGAVIGTNTGVVVGKL